MEKQSRFKTTITSEHRLFDLHLGETFRYRDLIFLFIRRDFISKYKQTILGPLWAIVQPVLTTLVFTVVFGRLARLTTADVPGDFLLPAFLFYMAGNICWSLFSSTVEATSNSFIKNSATMGKVYYPRLVAPISTAGSNLISFGIQLVLLVILMLVYVFTGRADISASPALLLIPLLIVHTLILGIGCGIIVSSVTTKYRDLAMLVGFGLHLWQYASPVAYGLELIPASLRTAYLLNPVTPIITTFRYALFGHGFFDPVYYLISLGVSLVIFFLGLILFSRIERTFMDTI